ncbi:hypothetical protein HQ560_19245, partial [bacterium]|nr:hypothetical protein [bacterium]
MHRMTLLLTAILAFGTAHGGSFPLEAVEAEHAIRLNGPARLARAAGAARLQCIELAGEKARASLTVRIARGGPYNVWVRALNADGKPASVTVQHGAVPPVKAVVGAREWAWTRLGVLPIKRGAQPLEVAATGAVRVDQILFAGDPGLVPKGPADTTRSLRTALADIYFADEFMRTSREAGAWQVVSGAWAIRELHVREKFDPTRSANAFSYLGTGTPEAPAIAIAGYPFWRNYSIEASVRSLAGEPFGLVILRQDEKNYYLFVHDAQQERFELVRCADGATTRLAHASGRLAANQWYRLRLDACDGRLTASVDGHRILEAEDGTFLTGQPGIWSVGAKGAFYDDVLVRSLSREGGSGLAGWQPQGQWKASENAFTGAGRILRQGEWGAFDLTVGVAS